MQESGLTLCFKCKSGYIIKIKGTSCHQHRPQSAFTVGNGRHTVSNLRLPPCFTCTITVTPHGQCWADKNSVRSLQCHTPQGSLVILIREITGWRCTWSRVKGTHHSFCSFPKRENTIKGNAREPSDSTPKETRAMSRNGCTYK